MVYSVKAQKHTLFLPLNKAFKALDLISLVYFPLPEDIKILCNRLFGYSTAYNNSEGAILSWIAGNDTGAQTPGGWGTAVSGHRNLKRFLLLYSESCFPESEMLKGFTFDILVFIFRNRKT